MSTRVLVTLQPDASPDRVGAALTALGATEVQPPQPELPDVCVATVDEQQHPLRGLGRVGRTDSGRGRGRGRSAPLEPVTPAPIPLRSAGQQATGVPSAILYCDRLSNSNGIRPRVGCARVT